MNFDELHEHIPYARFGKAKSLEMEPYTDIHLLLPGRHSEDTSPKGGDFCVCVTDKKVKWTKHQFKHSDIFNDIEVKASDTGLADLMKQDASATLDKFMESYMAVVCGEDPRNHVSIDYDCLAGVRPSLFLKAVQCLAVAEHRRYAQHEAKHGGRFLPFRFAAGIAEGLWTAHDAIQKQRFGRPAVERLEKTNGTPRLTQELMS